MCVAWLHRFPNVGGRISMYAAAGRGKAASRQTATRVANRKDLYFTLVLLLIVGLLVGRFLAVGLLFRRFEWGLLALRRGLLLGRLRQLADLYRRRAVLTAFCQPQVDGLANRQPGGLLAGHDFGALTELNLDWVRLLVLRRRHGLKGKALPVAGQRLDGPDAVRLPVAGFGLLVAGCLFARLGFLLAG